MSCRALLVVGGWLGGWVFLPASFDEFLQRARLERSMIERRVGQYMECVVLAPFSEQVRSKGFFGEPLKHAMTHMWANW